MVSIRPGAAPRRRRESPTPARRGRGRVPRDRRPAGRRRSRPSGRPAATCGPVRSLHGIPTKHWLAVVRVVHGDEAAALAGPGPREGDEVVRARRSPPTPGGTRGAARSRRGTPGPSGTRGRARRRRGSPRPRAPTGPRREVDRDPDLLPLALSLVEEAEPRREEREDRRRAVHLGREDRGGARLVVVLEEAREPVLVVEAREEVLPDGPRLAALEAVVEPLVVRVVEPLLLKRPTRGPSRPRRGRGTPDFFDERTRWPSARTGSARTPHVRSNTSGRTSMAMSHRTPSHCPAILSSSPSIACCRAGLP